MQMIFAPRASLFALALSTIALSGPALGQSYDPYNMEERLQRIEDQLRDLQDQMYQGGAPAGGGGGDVGVQRLSDMEQSLRNLTGQVEQFGYDIKTIKDKLTQLETETNFRLNQLEGNPGGSPPPAGADTGSDTGGGMPSEPSANPDVDSSDVGGPKPPGTIGEIEAPPAGSDVESLYNTAMDHLTRAEYDDALKLFKQVVGTYPESDEAAQAQYWIADIHYVRKDYESAAVAFAEVLKKYPTAGRGPEAMLKLGLSLINLDRKKDGCTTLAAIKGKYPKASDAILGRAEREAKKAGCK
jgi:tol-pal system protein YbgF